jgi:hypothetical protein
MRIDEYDLPLDYFVHLVVDAGSIECRCTRRCTSMWPTIAPEEVVVTSRLWRLPRSSIMMDEHTVAMA